MSSKIDSQIEENKVMIFIKPTCPFCIRAKQLLDGKGIKYGQSVVSGDIMSVLTKKTRSNTVPQIFIDGKHIGGCDELYAMNTKHELDNL